MMQFGSTNIFNIPVGDLLGRSMNDYHLVYSPLAQGLLLVDREELFSFSRVFEGHEDLPGELLEAAKTLLDYEPIEQRKDQIRSASDFVTLYVLPNYHCNFHCSYCFASQGRDKQQLDEEVLKRMLEWMLDINRTPYRNLHITFLGGGEPTLSWDVVKKGIEYASELSIKNGFIVKYSIVTNGSIVDEEMICLFRKYHVVPRLSFEILEEIQNKQRGKYLIVHQNLLLLQEAGLEPVIRSMITLDNVGRMEEMVEKVHQLYPSVKLLKFDPITDADTFADLDVMRSFYDDFYIHFLNAYRLSERYGIELKCAALRNLDSLVQRFCAGEISLNALGAITICHRISSPREEHYEEMVYGKVTTERVDIDYENFKKLTSDTVQKKEKCKECFVKFHCGGGCMAQDMQYTSEMQEIVCDFTRNFSRTILLERLDKQLQEESRHSISLSLIHI